MCATKSNGTSVLRIEPVDNWHGAWDKVMRHIVSHGREEGLRIDADGWLSARQVLMAAFVGDRPVAHVCFTVAPAKNSCVEAKLDSFGIDPKFCGRGIESQLHRATVDRARALRCEKLKGFKLNSKWC